MPKRENYSAHEGHRKLVASGLGPSAIAKIAGGSKQLAAKWLSGAVPGEKFRTPLEAKLGIRPTDWQTRVGASDKTARASVQSRRDSIAPPAAAIPKSLPRVTGVTVADQLTHISTLIRELQKGRKGAPLAESQRAIRYESQLVEIRARLLERTVTERMREEQHAAKMLAITEQRQQRAAESARITFERVVKSEAWQLAIGRFWKVLEAFPAAMEALREQFGEDNGN